MCLGVLYCGQFLKIESKLNFKRQKRNNFLPFKTPLIITRKVTGKYSGHP